MIFIAHICTKTGLFYGGDHFHRQTDRQTDRWMHLFSTLVKEGQCCAPGMCKRSLLDESIEDLRVKEVGEEWPLSYWTVL